MLQLQCVCLVNRRVQLAGGCFFVLELASPFLWYISAGGGSWNFHIVLLSSIQKSCTSVKNSLVTRTGLLLTLCLPKVHQGLFLVGVCDSEFQSYLDLWPWEQSLSRKVSSTCLYRSPFRTCVIKSERNRATLKGSELLELRLPGANKHVKTAELPGRYFWVILLWMKKTLGVGKSLTFP